MKLFNRTGALLTALGLLGSIVISAVNVTAVGPNLIANPSVATGTTTQPQAWTSNKWGTNTAALTYKTNSGRTDSRSLYVNVTNYTSGDAKWMFNNVAVQPGTSYTFSNYSKSNVSTRLVAQHISTTGAISYADIATIPASATTWKQTSVKLTTPANAKQLSVFHVINRVGWLQTDDYSLTDNTTVSTAPTVAFTAPASSATVSGTTALSASASTTSGTISGVQFKVNGVNIGAQDTTAPYSVNWDTKTVADGQHTLTAVARNSAGLTSTAEVKVTVKNTAPATPPTITIASPANGSTVSNTITATANVTSTGTTVGGVQFKVDGANLGAEDTVAPYTASWNTTAFTNGAHTLTATVRDSANQSATATANVTINNTVPTPEPATNLVPNASLEETTGTAPTSWLSNSWGANTPVFTYPVAGNGSAKAVRIEMTSRTDGDAKWYFQPQAVKAGASYTFKDTYRSNVATELVVAEIDANNNYTYSGFVSVPASSTWATADYTFKTAATTKTLTVFHVLHSTGWLETDTVSLSEVAADTSLLPNKSLETAASATLPLAWEKSSWGTNAPVFEYLNEGRTGARSVKVTMSNYVDGDAKWMPTPLTNLERGKQYRFSAWYKTNVQPQAVAMYLKDDGTTKFLGLPAPQPNGSANWQSYSDAFSVPLDAKAVSVFFYINSNGYLQTDDYDITSYAPVGFNRPMVTLTFDDGEEDNEFTALPIMTKYGIKSTQCFATDHIEGNAANTRAVLNFYNNGHEVCSHTHSHPFMTKLTPAQLTYELSHSKQVLESIIGQPVNNFASPYGDYNATVNAEIMKHYKSHRTVEEGYNSKDNFSPYRLRVQNMFSTTTIEEYNGWLAQAKADNTWLVLVYHRVANDPATYDTYVADFEKQMQALQASGLTVKTYQGALDEIYPQL